MNISTPNLNLTLKPSLALLISFVFLHALAIACIVIVSISIWIKASVVLLVLISGVYVTRQYVLLQNKNSIVKVIAVSTSNECKIEIRDGTQHDARIKHADWLIRYFAIIILNANSKIYKTIIAKDVLSQEQFYTLSLYLRSINTLR